MKNLKGKFVTIEGCEGVGKSTQIELLKDYCAKNIIDAVFTREPGGTPIAERIRHIILDPSGGEMDNIAELLLYAASRAQHINETIAPALKLGKTVFCDRFSDSTIAYQAYGRGLDLATVENVCAVASKGIAIDYTIFLDLNPVDGFSRVAARGNAVDRLEQAGLEFHGRVYKGFSELSKKHASRFIVVDASLSANGVHNNIINQLFKG